MSHSGKVSLIVLTAAGLTVAGAVLAERAGTYEPVHTIYAAATPANAPLRPKQPDARHLRAIRKLNFTWNIWIETGGPLVDPNAPYGGPNLRADLAPIAGTQDPAALAAFHVETAQGLVWALANGDLPAGRYSLARLNNAAIGQAMLDGWERLPPSRVAQLRAELPRLDPDGTFMFTINHRKLLKHLKFDWVGYAQLMALPGGGNYSVPMAHFKRPLGDMTAFNIDMATILGLPTPKGQGFDPKLWRLYLETLPALQAFVEHAKITTRP